MNAEVEQEQQEQQERNFEGEAREMGWVPQDEFHEDPAKWIDAEEFVKRGEEILPILRANNKKLKQDNLTKDAAIATLQQSLANQEKAIKALQKGYGEATKREVEKAKTELREQLKAAKASGDVDAELEIQDRLVDLRDEEQAAKKEAAESEEGSEGTSGGKFSPEYVTWQKQNPWFGDTSSYENRRKSRELVEIGKELRDKGNPLVGFAFMDACMEILDERESKRATQRTTSKVEGSGGGRTSAKSGRAFDRLPKEAKDACHTDNDSFVGAGKMFKTVAEWEDHYASLYGDD